MNDLPIAGEDYVYRDGDSEDEKYIFDTWLRHYSNSPANCFRKDFGEPHFLYWKYQGKLIGDILKRSKVVIACNSEFDDDIYGYCVYEVVGEKAVVHFCYVKSGFRKMGLCRSMINQLKKSGEKIALTHLCGRQSYVGRTGVVFLNKKYEADFVYSPLMAFGSYEAH